METCPLQLLWLLNTWHYWCGFSPVSLWLIPPSLSRSITPCLPMSHCKSFLKEDPRPPRLCSDAGWKRARNDPESSFSHWQHTQLQLSERTAHITGASGHRAQHPDHRWVTLKRCFYSTHSWDSWEQQTHFTCHTSQSWHVSPLPVNASAVFFGKGGHVDCREKHWLLDFLPPDGACNKSTE